jgi:hypothetical protein
MVFYLLELIVLALAYYLYFKESKVQEKKIWDPWGVWKEIK